MRYDGKMLPFLRKIHFISCRKTAVVYRANWHLVSLSSKRKGARNGIRVQRAALSYCRGERLQFARVPTERGVHVRTPDRLHSPMIIRTFEPAHLWRCSRRPRAPAEGSRSSPFFQVKSPLTKMTGGTLRERVGVYSMD